MAITTARINSIFKAFGLDPATHAAANGETVDQMLARMVDQHDQDSLVRSLLRAYPDQGDTFVANLFTSRGLDIAKGDETADQRISRILSELQSDRTFTDLQSSLDRQAGVTTGGPADTSAGATATKVAGSAAPGLLQGGTVYQVKVPQGADRFVYAFEYPLKSGKFVGWTFDSEEQVEASLGKDWFKTVPYRQTTQKDYSDNFSELQDIGGIAGATGNFYSMMNQAGLDAAMEMGISDPTLAGKILNDPEMQRVLAGATFGGWTEEKIMAEKRNTNFWKNELYPGIETLYGKTSNPEGAWVNYNRSVEDNLVQLGVPRDPDGSYKSQIGMMLNAGVEDTVFNDYAPSFVRAQRNAAYANVLNQWTQRDLGKTITFDDWFNVVAGEAPAEIADVVEKAGIQYVAEQQGLTLTSDQIGRVAELSDLTESQTAEAFTQYQQILTSLAGTLGNDPKYAITEDEILSLATGIKAPTGRSTEEIRKYAVQAAREAGALDDQKLQFFVGYDPVRGTPNRPGLNPLAPESA